MPIFLIEVASLKGWTFWGFEATLIGAVFYDCSFGYIAVADTPIDCSWVVDVPLDCA